MYFIARNNRLYNYIASTSRRVRYLFTLLVLTVIIGIWLSCVHCSFEACKLLYAHEYQMLQKKYEDGLQQEQRGEDLQRLIAVAQKSIQSCGALTDDKGFKNELFFILNAVQSAGLTLDTYRVLKEKNKDWYKKDSVHLYVVGSIEQCMSFIELIKKSQKMITLSDVSLVRVDGLLFKMNVDIGFVSVEKI